MNGKKKCALAAVSVLAASLILAAAGCGEVKINTGEIRAEGETTIIQTPTKTAAEYTPEENAYVVAGRLKSLEFYRSEVRGQVVAGFLNYKQTIEDTHIKNGDESYTQAKSMSMLVNVGKQAFFKGGKVVMRDATDVKKDKWSDDFSVTTLEDYREKRGAEPTALSKLYPQRRDDLEGGTGFRFGRGIYLPLRDRSQGGNFPLCGEDDELRRAEKRAGV